MRQYLEKGSKSSSSAQGGQRMQKIGGDNGPLVKINYNHSCDLERLEKFRIITQDLSKIKKFGRVFGFIFTSLLQLMPCQ